METALEILSRIGTDNPPSLDELRSARDSIARELHAQKGSNDLEALMSLREAYSVASAAIDEAEAAQAEVQDQIEDVLDGIPDPDGEPTEPNPVDDNSGRVLPLREAVERLGLIEPTVEVVGDRPSDPADDLASVTHEVQIGAEVRDEATFRDLAEAFASGRSLKNGRERVARITSHYAEGRTLSGKIDENTSLIDSLVSPEAVTAAGGCCSLPTPIYDNPVLGSTARPIRDSLPTIGATRGKVMFYPAVCLPQAGADVWTCADDAAVDDEDEATWKQCADATCDDEQTADVDAIYKCLTVGVFQSRFSPEQWEARLRAVAVAQARLAEVNLFSKMRAGVTSTHTGLATGSTYLNVVNTAIRATALMRQDQRLAEVQFDFYIAEWVKAAIAEGFGINRLDKGGDMENVEQLLAAALGAEGIRPVYSLDIDDLEGFQYDGALADYPAVASTVLAPNGYFSFLDGGSFDLGTEVRDHSLARKNQLAAFAESFEGLLARGCNAKALDIPIECDLTIACPA